MQDIHEILHINEMKGDCKPKEQRWNNWIFA